MKTRSGPANKKKSVKKDSINTHFHSLNPERIASGHGMRTKATIKRLQMYRNFKPKRDRTGKIIKEAPFQGKLASGTVARVAPDRRWFGNTRLISQDALQKFQEELKRSSDNPYEIILKRTALPVTLLNEASKYKRVHLLDIESFKNTFGPKAQRKRPRLISTNIQEFFTSASSRTETYQSKLDPNLITEDEVIKEEALHPIFKAGTSKRIWNELYKVIDSSDVLLQVLDARDPMGTRCTEIEAYLKKEKPHKHVVLVLNKCDLVPVSVTRRWLQILSKELPTIVFRASIMNAFGKSSLINLLRQYALLHKERKQISVGLIGYPNVGKSSIINTLKKKNVCNVAPIAGETKVWQYVTLMKRIYMIDCPGIVYPRKNSDTDLILKGVIRVENVPEPEQYVDEVLRRVKTEHLEKAYGISGWKTAADFMEMFAKHSGRLLKGGEPDFNGVARIVLNDFQRAKLPHFIAPPEISADEDAVHQEDGKNTKIDEILCENKNDTTEISSIQRYDAIFDEWIKQYGNSTDCFSIIKKEVIDVTNHLIDSIINNCGECESNSEHHTDDLLDLFENENSSNCADLSGLSDSEKLSAGNQDPRYLTENGDSHSEIDFLLDVDSADASLMKNGKFETYAHSGDLEGAAELNFNSLYSHARGAFENPTNRFSVLLEKNNAENLVDESKEDSNDYIQLIDTKQKKKVRTKFVNKRSSSQAITNRPRTLKTSSGVFIVNVL